MRKQPMLCNWINIKYRRFDRVIISNEMTDEKFITEEGAPFVEFLHRLDGVTDPHYIPCCYSFQEIDAILGEISNLGLIRQGRWLSKSISCFAYSLIMPKKQQTDSLFVKLLNFLMYISFLPIFICGISSFISSLNSLHFNGINLPGVITGLLMGIVFHELGHIIPCLAYGGKVFEIGVMLSHLVIPGAYVVMKDAEDLLTARRIQCIAGGVEQNLILSGVAFSLASKVSAAVDFWFCIALINLGLAFLNLILRSGNDGCHILSYLFGVDDEDIVDIAKVSLFNRINRIKLYYNGAIGKASLLSYALILLLQIATPITILINIMEVIVLWFG